MNGSSILVVITWRINYKSEIEDVKEKSGEMDTFFFPKMFTIDLKKQSSDFLIGAEMRIDIWRQYMIYK